MLSTLRDGFRSLGRNWGLVVLVLVVNLALALVLAVPLALQLERDLSQTGASGTMMYGFDYDWWTEWSERQEGPSSTFAPDVFGPGFAFKNLDLLLRGGVPLGIFPEGGDREPGPPDRTAAPPVAPLVLGVGALYLLVQVFLTGGLLGVFRAPQGGWTFRGLVHGSGFYCGRLLRVSLLALGLAGLVFTLNVPFARWADELAREAVSERTALALGLGRHALLLLALLLVHMVASFARCIGVERRPRPPLRRRVLCPEPPDRPGTLRGDPGRGRAPAGELGGVRRPVHGDGLEDPAGGLRGLPGVPSRPDRPAARPAGQPARAPPGPSRGGGGLDGTLSRGPSGPVGWQGRPRSSINAAAERPTPSNP